MASRRRKNKQHQRLTRQQGSGTAKGKPAPSLPAVRVDSPGVAKAHEAVPAERHAENDCENHRSGHSSEGRIAKWGQKAHIWSAVAVAFFTFVQVGVTYWQLSAMNYQNREFIRQNSMLSEQNDLARGAQRAWLGARISKVEGLAEGEETVVTMQITNTGSTPAVLTSYGFLPFLVPYQLAEDRKHFDENTTNDHDASTAEIMNQPVAPGSSTEFVVRSVRKLSAEEMESVTNGSNTYFVVGRVDYRDAFGEKHVTKVSWGYDRHLKKFVEASYGNQMD